MASGALGCDAAGGNRFSDYAARGPRHRARADGCAYADAMFLDLTAAGDDVRLRSAAVAAVRELDAREPQPGASSSGRVGTMCGALPQPVETVEAGAFDDTSAEGRALLVVAPFELETEEPIDERGGVAALEPMTPQAPRRSVRARRSSVSRSSRRRRPRSPRARSRSVGAPRGAALTLRAHRAEQRAGVARNRPSTAETSGSLKSIPPSCVFERVRLHLVHADVLRREPHEVLRTQPTERSAPCTVSRSTSA